MAKPGDVILHPEFRGFIEIIVNVNEGGEPAGGWLIPPGQPKKLIDALVQEAKRLATL